MYPDAIPDPGSYHVLVVEDDVLVRFSLAEELRAAGLRVAEASNADEAWAYLASGADADMMVSDVQMPGSMDGLILAGRVAAEFPRTRIILTSGSAVAASGQIRFLPKPYDPLMLVGIVVETLTLPVHP